MLAQPKGHSFDPPATPSAPTWPVPVVVTTSRQIASVGVPPAVERLPSSQCRIPPMTDRVCVMLLLTHVRALSGSSCSAVPGLSRRCFWPNRYGTIHVRRPLGCRRRPNLDRSSSETIGSDLPVGKGDACEVRFWSSPSRPDSQSEAALRCFVLRYAHDSPGVPRQKRSMSVLSQGSTRICSLVAPRYGSGGQGFESLRPRHSHQTLRYHC